MGTTETRQPCETKQKYDKRLQSTTPLSTPGILCSLVLGHIFVSLAAVRAAVHTAIGSIHTQVLHGVAHRSTAYGDEGHAKQETTSIADDDGLANLDHGGLGQSPLTIRMLLIVGMLWQSGGERRRLPGQSSGFCRQRNEQQPEPRQTALSASSAP